MKEYETVTTAVGLKDLSTFAKIRVKSGEKTSEFFGFVNEMCGIAIS